MYPSTCGLIVAECRDFKMDKYSVVSGMFSSCATFTCTGIAGGAPPPGAPAPPAEVFPQPVNTAAASNTAATAARLRLSHVVSVVCESSIIGDSSMESSTKSTPSILEFKVGAPATD